MHSSKIPDTVAATPTIFNDMVYSSLQHALFAFLIFVNGGMTGNVAMTIYPRGTLQFPHFVIHNPVTALSLDDDLPLAVHLLPSDPSHSMLHHLVESNHRFS